jgi:hypothetical protein
VVGVCVFLLRTAVKQMILTSIGNALSVVLALALTRVLAAML